MKELKFELSIPATQIERLIQSALIVAFGLTTPGITVKMQEEFIPSCGSEGKSGPKPKDGTEEYIWEEKGKPKDVADVLKEAMSEVNKMNTEPRKEHWTKKLENSLLTKLIAFKCDCGHITWRLCKDGDFKCECNKCNKVHEWDITELYRLEYSCKCGYRKYLYMPLSHRIEEMAELQKELSKNLRGVENSTSIAEEIADVEIMLEQMKALFEVESQVDKFKMHKLGRLKARLLKDKKGGR